MKKLIKLRDLTKEQWDNWLENNCNLKVDCENCLIYRANCDSSENEICWINNKDIYSDKFLDQEVEIEIENEELLSKEEKEYLSFVIKPFRDRIKYIEKIRVFSTRYIFIFLEDNDTMTFPNLPSNRKMYENMIEDYKYTLGELGL